eukprot:TRINITY_DN1357_c0_g2_i2.p1 TRINITY_DN1357_c0_g2~~TRINITY_DN1357_c0_g2_i2.p1  ORF type:complete len:527 (+),score=86.21 TRINITY_DN1357_c0_g2_i2:159-1583(+)
MDYYYPQTGWPAPIFYREPILRTSISVFLNLSATFLFKNTTKRNEFGMWWQYAQEDMYNVVPVFPDDCVNSSTTASLYEPPYAWTYFKFGYYVRLDGWCGNSQLYATNSSINRPDFFRSPQTTMYLNTLKQYIVVGFNDPFNNNTLSFRSTVFVVDVQGKNISMTNIVKVCDPPCQRSGEYCDFDNGFCYSSGTTSTAVATLLPTDSSTTASSTLSSAPSSSTSSSNIATSSFASTSSSNIASSSSTLTPATSTGCNTCWDGSCKLECPSTPVTVQFDPVIKPIDPIVETIAEVTVAKVIVPARTFQSISNSTYLYITNVPIEVIRASIANDLQGISRFISTPIRILLMDAQQNKSIENVRFSIPVAIALDIQTANTKSLCLAFINRMQRWECIDNDILISKNGSIVRAIGETTHFSDFAVLFDEDENPQSNHESKDKIPSYAFIIIGCVAGLIVIVGAIAVVMRKRRRFVRSK